MRAHTDKQTNGRTDRRTDRQTDATKYIISLASRSIIIISWNYCLSRLQFNSFYFLRGTHFSGTWLRLGHGQLIPWMADRPMQWKYSIPSRKIKMGTQYFFYFGIPTLTLGLLVPQKWFTYQNLQNFTRKIDRLFFKTIYSRGKSQIF